MEKKQSKPMRPTTKIDLIIFSVALAISMSAIINLGVWLLSQFITPAVQHAFEPGIIRRSGDIIGYAAIPALFYAALRFAKADQWLRFRLPITIMFGTTITLIVLYETARIWASSIQGGGMAFAVAMFSLVATVPAILSFIIAFIWLAIRSIKLRKMKSVSPLPVANKKTLVGSLVIGGTIASAALVPILRPGSPVYAAQEAARIFAEQCRSSGEVVSEKPQGVTSLYIDKTSRRHVIAVKNGESGWSSSGVFAMYSSLPVGFVTEEPNPNKKPDAEKFIRYTKTQRKNEKQLVNDVVSQYGVFGRTLFEQKLTKRESVLTSETSVKDMVSNKVIATYVFTKDTLNQKVCGKLYPSKDGSEINTEKFVFGVIGLVSQ